ncbi:MAG: alpha/beta hydrolase [Actinomycetota bacterium]
MELHPEARAVIDLYGSLDMPAIETLSPPEARASRASLRVPSNQPCREIDDIDAGGVSARRYRNTATGDATGLLVWIHGGGWVTGDLDGADPVARSLAVLTGHTVLSVDYRLAPEDPFPAGLDDCHAALTWASEHAATLRIDPARIAIGGDSAGANLAAVVANETTVPLVHQLLVYPVTDARASRPAHHNESYLDERNDLFLTAAAMTWFVDQYLAGTQVAHDDPRVSPLHANADVLASGPPATVFTAGFDQLRDEGAHYAQRLAGAGVPTSHVHFAAHTHGFFAMHTALGDARMAQAAAAQALCDAFGS